MKFAPKHVVTIVCAISAAAVLAPVGVLAATGTLVNVTDPFNSGRKARVTDGGSLLVENRAGNQTGAASRYLAVSNLTNLKLAEAVYPERIAVTEVTVGSHGPTNGAVYGHNYVDVVAYVQQSGTAACGMPNAYGASPVPPGYTKQTLRRFVVRNQQQSIHATWDGPALVVPPATGPGRRVCVQLDVALLSTETSVFMGGTAYKYIP